MTETQSEESEPREKGWNNTQRMVVSAFAVFAVFAGALAFLFPLLQPRGAHFRRSTRDLSNLKQLDLGLIMYASDFDDIYPRTSKWMDDIQPYVKNELILHSIELTPPDRAPTRTDPYGFAFRKSLASVNSAKLSTPEQVAVIFDSSDLSRNASGELNLLPSPPRHQDGGRPFNFIGFVDGHVKAFRMPLVGVK